MLLTQNRKMKKSSKKGIGVYNFGIPAFKSASGFKTCPAAKNCITSCYASQGMYVFSNVRNAFEKRLEATKSNTFIRDIQIEIDKLVKKHKQVYIRVHDSGDFYSESYFKKWMCIAWNNPTVKFYAYTKQILLIKDNANSLKLNPNFKIIFSFGGTQDKYINTKLDAHSFVFKNLSELRKAGYKNASKNDLVAVENKKVGLIYHGRSRFENTSWGKVKL